MLDYTLFEDEELVALSKQGKNEAFSVLSERYFSTAGYHASRFCSSLAEKEDLIQEGMLGFISAVYAFDEKEGASFSTFANHCIRNRIISSVRSLSSKKHIPAELVISLDGQDFASQGKTPEESFISQKEAERIYLLIKHSLTEKERQCFLLLLSGMSYEQIAVQLDCTVKSVDSTLQRVRKKLREKLS